VRAKIHLPLLAVPAAGVLAARLRGGRGREPAVVTAGGRDGQPTSRALVLALRPAAARRIVPVTLMVLGLFGLLLVRGYVNSLTGFTKHYLGVSLLGAPGLGQGLLLPLAWGMLLAGGWLTWRSADPVLAVLRARAPRLTAVPLRSQLLALALVPAAMMTANMVLHWYLTFEALAWVVAAGAVALFVAARWPRLAAQLAAGLVLVLGAAGLWVALTRGSPDLAAPSMDGLVLLQGPDTVYLAVAQAVLLVAAGTWLVPQVFPVARRLLGLPEDPWQRVEQLTRSRAVATAAAAADLRRLERDLHDGAQARLVALGMTLRAAEQLFPASPDAAVALVGEARQAAAQALTELRDLVRGVHPPVLADRGLPDAVRALALDCPLRVKVQVDLPGRLPAPVETACYFAVSELLTNAAKHSGARDAEIAMTYYDGRLRIQVTDPGLGGAEPAAGTGLAGVERRLAAFDGILAVNSPAGGPTVIAIELPCTLSPLGIP
jgi:signal transduction histidine kinase